LGERETALEEGWLLAELEQRFGYGLEELARRFDRSTSWVSRRLALVDQLPESVQQQVRDGAITAHVAMKFLVPVARSHPDDCQRLAEALAVHRFSSREAGQLYAAWRNASPAIRQRILEQPQLFLKTQRQREPEPPSTAIAELARDLEMVVAITAGPIGGWRVPALSWDRDQCAQLRHTMDRALHELGRLAPRSHPSRSQPMLSQAQRAAILELDAQQSEQTRDRAGAERLPFDGAQSPAVERGTGATVPRSEKAEPHRQQILELLHTCKGNLVRVQEELTANGRPSPIRR